MYTYLSIYPHNVMVHSESVLYNLCNCSPGERQIHKLLKVMFLSRNRHTLIIQKEMWRFFGCEDDPFGRGDGGISPSSVGTGGTGVMGGKVWRKERKGKETKKNPATNYYLRALRDIHDGPGHASSWNHRTLYFGGSSQFRAFVVERSALRTGEYRQTLCEMRKGRRLSC